MRTLSFIILLGVLPVFSISGCQKNKDKKTVLKELYKLYENGQISECTLDGKTVFTGSINAYDAPTVVYDEKGNEIGTCNYAWGSVDPLCYELKGCKVVYCVENNIWGQPSVDKYDLN